MCLEFVIDITEVAITGAAIPSPFFNGAMSIHPIARGLGKLNSPLKCSVEWVAVLWRKTMTNGTAPHACLLSALIIPFRIAAERVKTANTRLNLNVAAPRPIGGTASLAATAGDTCPLARALCRTEGVRPAHSPTCVCVYGCA